MYGIVGVGRTGVWEERTVADVSSSETRKAALAGWNAEASLDLVCRGGHAERVDS